MHYLLIYDAAPDYVTRRAEHRAEHLRLAWLAAERGEIVLAGAYGEPIEGAMLLFEGESPEPAERFAEADPYVRNGLVRAWRVVPWHTVVGHEATQPIRGA
jgi:uncharacterized protein YciI